jgi:hypothetical protein
MAEAHKFSTLDKALEVFPELTWAQDGDGATYVDNSKTGERVPVAKGQYIVKIADRYEVQDEAPDNAKTAEKPAAEPKATAKEAKDERSAPATDQSNPQVAPEAIGSPADSNPAAPAASVDASAAPAAE